MPRYWRFVVAALVGLAAGAIFRGGFVGVIVGVFVALTIILIVESRARRGARKR